MKILCAGGGTMGSVTPLIAMIEQLKKQGREVAVLFVGTSRGPERRVIAHCGYRFVSIASGKLRKYVSIHNVFTPFGVAIGCIQSLLLVWKEKPDIILTAGSFVAVPVAWAGKILHVPVLVHQQDIHKGLANRLMERYASKITVTFQETLHEFENTKTVWTGNPVRPILLEARAHDAISRFSLSAQKKTLLVVGGGTGSVWINHFISDHINKILEHCQVIHVTGQGKEEYHGDVPDYHVYEFLEYNDMALAYAVSDAVVCRAGLSTITELSQLSKPAIVIPMPESHQEDNAAYLWQKKAAVVLDQNDVSWEKFSKALEKVLINQQDRLELSKAISDLTPKDATEKATLVVEEMLGLVDAQ